MPTRSPSRTVTCRSRIAVRPAVEEPRGRSAMAPSNSGDRPRCAARWSAFGPLSCVHRPAHSTPNSVNAESMTVSNRRPTSSAPLTSAAIRRSASDRESGDPMVGSASVRPAVSASVRDAALARAWRCADPSACALGRHALGGRPGCRGRAGSRLGLRCENHVAGVDPFGSGRRGIPPPVGAPRAAPTVWAVGRGDDSPSVPTGGSGVVRRGRIAVNRRAGPPRCRGPRRRWARARPGCRRR